MNPLRAWAMGQRSHYTHTIFFNGKFDITRFDWLPKYYLEANIKKTSIPENGPPSTNKITSKTMVLQTTSRGGRNLSSKTQKQNSRRN